MPIVEKNVFCFSLLTSAFIYIYWLARFNYWIIINNLIYMHMNENLLLITMYLWALANLAVSLSVIRYRLVKTPYQQKHWAFRIRTSMFLNIGVAVFVCNGAGQHIYLWLLLVANVLLASWSIRFIRRSYEEKLKNKKLMFQIARVKHNTAHGTVEIDGIRYQAFIPPVWLKEYQDENGRLFPGTYKRYQVQTVQKARFKRFVPTAYGAGNRLMVELG